MNISLSKRKIRFEIESRFYLSLFRFEKDSLKLSLDSIYHCLGLKKRKRKSKSLKEELLKIESRFYLSLFRFENQRADNYYPLTEKKKKKIKIFERGIIKKRVWFGSSLIFKPKQ